MDARRPLAWMVVDATGRRSIFTDEARADAAAVTQHGIKVALLRSEPCEEPVAWIVVSARGARFAVLHAHRAHQLANEMQGTAVGLTPDTPLPTPEPNA